MPISTLIISIHTIGDIVRHVLNYFSYAKNFGGDIILSRKVSPLAHVKVSILLIHDYLQISEFFLPTKTLHREEV